MIRPNPSESDRFHRAKICWVRLNPGTVMFTGTLTTPLNLSRHSSSISPMPIRSPFPGHAAVLAAALCSLPLAHAVHAADASGAPDPTRFTPVVLTEGTLDEPMVFEVLPDGRVFIAERKGALKVYDPSLPGVKTMGFLAVNMQGNNEQGLAGMTVDPKFAQNGHVYLFYYHPTEAKAVISRWQVRNDVLVANSEKVMIEFPAQRETCCHTGGGMTWDEAGNLYITIGNNTGNALSAHTDERPGRSSWDDQRGASNTDSLEGKILRIHPEADGTYTIPKGNLFPPGTPKTRPEIYTMGHRNAWRVSVDSQTGFVYWGEVGPDAQKDTDIGPRGYDELNQARGPGFFGWPYFVGDSAFPWFDYAANKPGAMKDPAHPVNSSPNNTGLKELPPMSPSFIYYPYAESDKFPEVGKGGRSAVGGPIYHRSDFPNAKRPWPAYFEGKWIATDLSRGWMMAISMKPNGDYDSMERILKHYKPVEPIDLKFGPTGDLYVLEYGSKWFQFSPDAKLVRIEYEGGNRKPLATIAADKRGGTPPFEVKLSSEGTRDPDGDALSYRWEIFETGQPPRVFTEPNPTVKLESVGSVVARLTVSDPAGASESQSVGVVSGNEPPKVDVQVKGNSMFYFPGHPLPYAVDVTDTEDGSVARGSIPAERVAFTIDYAAANFDVAQLQAQTTGDAVAARFPVAQALLAKANCKACHLVEGRLVGPGFAQIAAKYRTDADAPERLAKKIVSGGGGVWGEASMPPNALVSEADAASILQYVLSLGGQSAQTLPLSGEFVPQPPKGDDSASLILRAVYTDQGGDANAPLSSQAVKMLRNPVFSIQEARQTSGLEKRDGKTFAKPGARWQISNVDLTGIGALELGAQILAGGDIEIRLDDPVNGTLLGQTTLAAQSGGSGGKAPPTSLDHGLSTPAAPSATPVLGGVTIPLKAASGTHTLFVLFKNAPAKPDERMMALSKLTLAPGRP
jgi:cytochrome c